MKCSKCPLMEETCRLKADNENGICFYGMVARLMRATEIALSDFNRRDTARIAIKQTLKDMLISHECTFYPVLNKETHKLEKLERLYYNENNPVDAELKKNWDMVCKIMEGLVSQLPDEPKF